MPETLQEQRKRQIAYKVRIKEIISGKYVKEEGEWTPNYIETAGKHVSRVNLIGTVVSAPSTETNFKSFVLDDGSGKINVRSFEKNNIFSNIDIGDVILMIGRPREYGSEKYIVPEIIKKIDDHRWLKVRALELEKDTSQEKIKTEIKIEEIKETPLNNIFNIIKELDKADGVDIEEIISVSKNQNVEKIIKTLLEGGEIFEIRPGKFRVLE